MTEEIKYIIKVDDKGAVAGIEKFEAAVKKSDDTTKATSSSMIGSFVKVAGSIAAVKIAYEALQYAMEQSKIGSQLLKQEIAFSNLAKSSSTTSDKIIADMSRLSKSMISTGDLIQASGRAMMLGIPADKLADLMKIAEATSRQTGQTVTEAFNDITLAVGRQSKMILDNLGIIVDVEKANQDYAKTLNKTSESLTDTEKKQAFMNATLRAGAELINRIGEGKDDLNATQQFAASFKNFTDEVAKIFAEKLNPAIKEGATFMDKMAQSAKEFRLAIQSSSTAVKDMGVKEMQDEVDSYDKMTPHQRNMSYTGQQMSQIEAMRKRLKEYKYPTSDKLDPTTRVLNNNDPTALTDPDAIRKQREANVGFTPEEAYKNRLDNIAEEVKKREELFGIEKGQAALDLKRIEQYGTEEELINAKLKVLKLEYQQYTDNKINASKWYEESKQKLEDEIKLLEHKRQLESGEFTGESQMQVYEGESSESRWAKSYGLNEKSKYKAGSDKEKQLQDMKDADKKLSDENWWKTYIDDADEAKRVTDIFNDSMNIMSQNISDVFGKFATGAMSASAAFKSMIASMISGLARLASQKGFEMLFGYLLQAGMAYAGSYGSTPTGMDTNSYTQTSAGQTGGGWAGGYSAANGAIFPGGFQAFASGGTVTGPTLGLVGEGKYNEAIVPLPDGRSIPVQMQGGSNRDVTVNINVDGGKGGTPESNDRMAKQIAREVKEEVKKIIADERRYGGSLGAQAARSY